MISSIQLGRANASTSKNGNRALCALYSLTALTLVVIWQTLAAAPAFAYVDPSVMTYTIQALAGLAVALSAVIGVVFRRTRRKIYQIFNIDENANKVSEADVARIDPAQTDAERLYQNARSQAIALAEGSDAAARKRAVRNLKWPARIAFALIMCIFVAFIAFIAPALEIIGANADSLVFGLQAIWWVPTLFCMAFAIVLAFVLSLLKGRPFYIAALLLFLVGIAAYVQSLFLNQGMMPADGGFLDWSEPYFTNKMTLSGAIWLLILIGGLAASWRYQHTVLKGAAALACAIIVVQAVGIASVALDAGKTAVVEQERPYVTQNELLTVSAHANVIEFVLDTYDTSILDSILDEDPAYLRDFEDFTYFHNSAGTMIPTSNAIPNMLTGLKPEPGQDLGEYRSTKYERATFIDDIASNNYSIGIYTDSLMANFDNDGDRRLASSTVNIHPVSKAPIDVCRTFIASMQVALYREAPWVLKPYFWYYTSDLNNRMIADGDSANLNDSLYELDDAAILDLLESRGLEIADDGKDGSYRFIHLFGPHFPFSVDESGQNIGTNQSDQISQAKGSMRVVIEYMNCLKKLGLYDEATIIVTADHGVWDITQDPIEWAVSPIMLVKPSMHEDHECREARVSEMPVSHDDLQPTVIDAIGLDSGKYGTTVFEVNDPSRIRHFDALTNVGDDGQRFVEYAITGDVLDLDGWEKTGNIWYGA